MIIGLANSKGGVGKSTIARNLITYLNDIHVSTALIDAEEGAPTATLLQGFDSKLVTRSTTTLEQIDDAVSELVSSGFHIIFDAPGKDGDQVSTLCLLSDLVIIPLCVSEQDLLQTVRIVEFVRSQQCRSKDMKPAAVILFTRTLKNDIATPTVRAFLENFGIPIAKTEIRERVAVKRNITVMRDTRFFQNDGPANDIVRLTEEVVLPQLSSTQRIANE